MLPKAKVALLRVAKARLGLSDDDYRAVLTNFGGGASAHDLDGRGFEAVMSRFRSLGFVSDAWRRGHGERSGMATPAQVELIAKLWREVAREPTDNRLNAWLERFGVSALRFVDAATAKRVIAALKAWKAREVERDKAD